MKVLKLNDGTEFQVYDESDSYRISMNGNAETTISAMEKITTENLKNATLGGEALINKIMTGGSFTPPDEATGEINLVFSLRDKTDMEIVQERLDEQDAALIELAELIGG